MKVGDKIQSTKMTQDSFYKAARGVIVDIKNGFVKIKATQVIDKWSKTWYDHPTSCLVHVKIEDLKLM